MPRTMKRQVKTVTVELKLTPEQYDALRTAAVLYVDAKRAVYEALYAADPVTYADALDLRRRQAEAYAQRRADVDALDARMAVTHGPALEALRKQRDKLVDKPLPKITLPPWDTRHSLGPARVSAYDVAKQVFDKFGGNHQAHLANQAEQDACADYRRWRQDIRKHKRSLPNPNGLSFRVRGTGWKLRYVGGTKGDRFVAELRLVTGAPLSVSFRTRTMIDGAHDYLVQMADGKVKQPAITLSSPFVRDFKRGIRAAKGGTWSLGIPIEVFVTVQARKPVDGRHLIITAPEDQDLGMFLECRIPGAGFKHGDWFDFVAGHDLADLRDREKQLCKTFGRHWSQTTLSCSHGRGRKRARQGLAKRRKRYAAARTNWIGNASKFLVDLAIEHRCGGIQMEDLTKRDPELLLPGAFAYHEFQREIARKATEAGLTFALVKQPAQAVSDAMAAQGEVYEPSGANDRETG